MNFPFLSRFKKTDNQRSKTPIVIVSGLPRSGTSMMMKMLEAGRIPILTDHERTPDESNPKGYYEYERVKKLRSGDQAWLEEAQGKAVKVISALLEYLPSSYPYKVIFMRRNMVEILASQRQMMLRMGEDPDKVDDDEMAKMFQHHLAKIEAWLDQQSHMDVLSVSYNDTLVNPQQWVERIQQFLTIPLDGEQMQRVVDKTLYRQRERQS